MKPTRASSLACILLLSATFALAQGSGNMPPPGGPDGPRMERPGPREMGMHLLPPGTWWKNPTTVQTLALTADQQKHLDDIFLQSRIQLVHLRASLDEEQLKLEPLVNSASFEEARALALIAKIADLRADLEKADARMLLSLRGVLTGDQWTKLQADQRSRRENHPEKNSGRGSRHREAPGGPGGPNSPEQPPPPPGNE